MATVSWTDGSGNWTTSGDWSTGSPPGPGDDAVLGGTTTYTVSLTSPITVDSITLSNAGATLAIDDPGGAETLSAGLDIAGGEVKIDDSDSGGSTVHIGGTLTAAAGGGSLVIGNSANTNTSATLVTAGGLAEGGNIQVFGGSSGGAVATLDITSAAPTVWSGSIELGGNAVVEFAGGSIASNTGIIAFQGASNFFADSGSPGSNGALAGLTANAGTIELDGNGASVVVSGGLTNTGLIELDFFGANGGNTLSIGGTLVNSGTISVGNANMTADSVISAGSLVGAETATAIITLSGGNGHLAALEAGSGAAPTVLSATLNMAGNALLEFGSGSITSVAGQLFISGPNALIEDAGQPGNSALSGLTSDAGQVELSDVALTTSVGLTVSSGATFDVDVAFGTGAGGSTVVLGGTLINNGFISIGDVFGNLTAPTTVSAGALVNGPATSNGGSIDINGGAGSDTNEATLVIGSAAPGTWTGAANIDSNAAITFTGGSINSVTSNAELFLTGATAFIEDAGQLGSSSALTGLTSNAGSLILQNGASLATSSGLVNTGILDLDINTSTGGGQITISGTLTNVSAAAPNGVHIGNIDLSAATTVFAAGLVNGGDLSVIGGAGTDTNQATLAIAGAAPAVLNGSVTVEDRATIAFGSGAVSSIGSGASLELDGAGAAITVVSGGSTASALAGLVMNAGTLTLGDGAALSIGAGAGFTNSATVGIDPNPSLFLTLGSGGSRLTVVGALTNAGTISVGNAFNSSGSELVVSAGVSGGGTISLAHSGTVVEFASSVAAGQTVSFAQAAGTVALDDPTGFGGTIAGLAVGSSLAPTNEIDLTAIASSTISSASLDTSTDQLSVVLDGGSSFAIQLSGAYGSTTFVDRIVDAGGSGTDLFLSTNQPCFCRGTLIRTERGEVAVEALAIGDRLVTAAGLVKPVRWIGRRGYDGRFVAGNRTVLPIRIAAGALADGVPARDLFVSREHALWIDGMLVPAGHLVNGATIVRAEAVARLEYFNIEFDAHEIILAEGMPTESYVDCDNRLMFANGAEYAQLYPRDERPRWRFCATRLDAGSAELAGIRARLLERAEALGCRLTDDPDLHLVVDGAIVRPASVAGGTHRFDIPAGSRAVWLASRSAVPAEVDAGSRDIRRLGVAVERIALGDGERSIEAWHGDAALRDGFHEDEGSHRWTDGLGRLPESWLRSFPGGARLDVHLTVTELGYRLPPPPRIDAAAA